MSRYSILLFIIVSLFVLRTDSLLALTIYSNLSLGSKGAEVVNLQQFLVEKGYLHMPTGVSYGYFGPLTKAAVSTWQVDTGIYPAVGFFGPISRAAISNQTAAKVTVPTIAPPAVSLPTTPVIPPTSAPTFETDTPRAPGMRANRVMLFRAYPFEVRPGDLVTLDGSGFSKTKNEVSFSGGNTIIATSTNGTILKFSVPSLSAGKYQISVTNTLGVANKDNPNIKVTILVTDNPEPAPTIESASINGDIITVVGNGFTSTNRIITTFGNPSNTASSNGTILTFLITDLPRYNQIKQFPRTKHRKAPLWIYVKNEHGINKDPYKLEIII